jgi:hypothetical protein
VNNDRHAWLDWRTGGVDNVNVDDSERWPAGTGLCPDSRNCKNHKTGDSKNSFHTLRINGSQYTQIAKIDMNAKIAIIEKNEIQLLMAEISLISVSGGSLFRRRKKQNKEATACWFWSIFIPLVRPRA